MIDGAVLSLQTPTSNRLTETSAAPGEFPRRIAAAVAILYSSSLIEALLKISEKEDSQTGMDSALKSKLREMTPELSRSLKLVNTQSVATFMWSVRKLNEGELDVIMSFTESGRAVSKLIEYTCAKGDETIKALAEGLKYIEMTWLAEQLYCAAATNTVSGAPAAEGSLSGGDVVSHLKDLAKNLGNNIEYIASRLTLGDTETIIAKLRSINENFLSELDYEDLKELKGAIRKATALLDILKKKESTMPFFAAALKDIGRTDLCNVVLNGRV